MLMTVLDIFTQLAEINQQLGEVYKVRAYQNAIVSLKRLPSNAKFSSCEELLQTYDVPGLNVKGSLCRRIDEILETGECQELNELLKRPDIKVYRDLISIHDIGVKLAKKLIKEYKVRSIDHLRELVKKGTVTLSRGQTLGLIHHKHLSQRVPYNEITGVIQRIKHALKRYPGLTIIGAGSYRRNCKTKGTSGDIDVLIFYQPGIKNVKLVELVDTLMSEGIILDYFGRGETKFQGLVGNQIVRQIDIRYIPIESYATALLYFTGSKNFNQNMRQKAIRLGYRLSEYHLTDLLHTNRTIPVKTEKDVFDRLKMKYVPPWKR